MVMAAGSQAKRLLLGALAFVALSLCYADHADPNVGEKRRLRRETRKLYSALQIEYFALCRQNLLSQPIISDGIISQNEFAEKLVEFCGTFTTQTIAGFKCPQPDFTSLPVRLQLIFAYAVCPPQEGKASQKKCLDSLDSLSGMGLDFGYIVTDETMPSVVEDVDHLCFGLFPFIFRK